MECSKTGCGQPRATGKPWCKIHLAQYQRRYQVAKLNRAASKGFVRGREAMRQMVVEEFDRLGSGMFTSSEVAGYVLRMPGPQPDDQTTEDEEETEKVEKVLS